ncbi:MAG: DUF3870 domain-containing protein [Firmicutes bacterium]|nr:DUF3870 domain-containing protein [Bacillota bacterium]
MASRGMEFGDEEKLAERTLFFTGYSKLPLTLTASKVYEAIVVAVTVDPDSSRITDVDCNLVTALGRNFIKGIVQGYCLEDGIEGLEREFEERYYGSARRAIVICLNNIYNRYLDYVNQKEQSEVE